MEPGVTINLGEQIASTLISIKGSTEHVNQGLFEWHLENFTEVRNKEINHKL